MFTGKFKLVYLVIKVVISTVIKEQKRIDLFEDRSRDNYDDRSFSGIDRSDINDRSIRNVLVFANRVTYHSQILSSSPFYILFVVTSIYSAYFLACQTTDRSVSGELLKCKHGIHLLHFITFPNYFLLTFNHSELGSSDFNNYKNTKKRIQLF